MARSSKVEECMYCGELPCICNAKPKKAAVKKLPKKAAPFANEAKLDRPLEDNDILAKVDRPGSMREAMKAVASKKSQSNIETLAQSVRWNQPIVQESVSEADESSEFEEAIRILHRAGLIHPDELERFPFLDSGGDGISEWKRWYQEATSS